MKLQRTMIPQFLQCHVPATLNLSHSVLVEEARAQSNWGLVPQKHEECHIASCCRNLEQTGQKAAAYEQVGCTFKYIKNKQALYCKVIIYDHFSSDRSRGRFATVGAGPNLFYRLCQESAGFLNQDKCHILVPMAFCATAPNFYISVGLSLELGTWPTKLSYFFLKLLTNAMVVKDDWFKDSGNWWTFTNRYSWDRWSMAEAACTPLFSPTNVPQLQAEKDERKVHAPSTFIFVAFFLRMLAVLPISANYHSSFLY